MEYKFTSTVGTKHPSESGDRTISQHLNKMEQQGWVLADFSSAVFDSSSGKPGSQLVLHSFIWRKG
jgi:hypothetical protein